MPRYKVPKARLAEELARFHESLVATRRHLRALQRRVVSEVGSDASADILDALLAITEDPELIDSVTKRVEKEGVNVEAVLDHVGSEYVKVLQERADRFFQERAVDVKDVMGRIQQNLLRRERRSLARLPHGTIVVAHELFPSDTCELDRDRVVGFATEEGSPTTHTAVLARSLFLPAVVGLRGISQRVYDGEPAILNGNSGSLVVEPTEQTLAIYRRWKAERQRPDEG